MTTRLTYGVWLTLVILFVGTLSLFWASALTSGPYVFGGAVLLIYISRPPKFFLSPRNIITAFYILWYCVGVVIGVDRYADFNFDTEPEVYSYIMLLLGFAAWYAGMVRGEEKIYKQEVRNELGLHISADFVFYASYIASIFFAILYVQNSGGIAHWLSDPGQALLKRGGSGVYVIAFFSSIHLSGFLGGYLYFKEGKRLPLILSLIAMVVFLPLLGGKGRGSFQFFLIVGNSIINKKTSWRLVLYSSVVVSAVFAAITFFRSGYKNATAEVMETVALNYFDTYQMLTMVVRDFSLGDKLTVLLPFNKFKSVIGQADGVIYDMSAWLTSIYFPTLAEQRAAVSAPIEADIYLSFYFFPGLIFIYFIGLTVGKIFNKATSALSCSHIYIALTLIMYILSHARGGIILWTDLWLFPTLYIAYLLLSPYSMQAIENHHYSKTFKQK